MQSAPKVELDSSEPSRFFAFERSLSNSTLSRGFLSQFRVGSRKNELQSCDELGYLEGKSSVEGPPSQRMHARILWRVILSSNISKVSR